MTRPSDDRLSRQAEKEYLHRSGAAPWERVKPFAPAGETTVAEGLHLIQDFGACVALLEPLPHHRILDLGAGGCWAADWLQRLGLSVVAVDLSYDLLAVGRERLARTGNAHIACADGEALPLRTASFDRVLCLNALHHFTNIPGTLSEIARVLGPEGLAVFSEPGVGHASQAHAVRAVRDFGVREADIDAGELLDQCRSAGFLHVVLEPFSHIVPGHGLTVDHWRTWRRLAKTSRPRRAAGTLRRGFLEFLGVRKDTQMFPEAFGSEALRVLRAAMQDHPIVVASKRPLEHFLSRSHGTAAMNAKVRLVEAVASAAPSTPILIKLQIQNNGGITWSARETKRGNVRVGAQLLDDEQRLLDRDYARQGLPHDVAPGTMIQVGILCTTPTRPGCYFVKIDLVSEGVSWFEPYGSKPVIHRLQVTTI